MNIPTPALNGSFLVKNTNGTFILLDNVSAPQFRWDAINSKFVWDATLDFTGAFNINSGSIVNFLDGSNLQDAYIANAAGSALTMYSNNGLQLIARDDDVYIAASTTGKKISLDTGLVEVTHDLDVDEYLTVGSDATVAGNLKVGDGFGDHYINFRPGNAGGAFVGLDIDHSASGSYIIQTGSSKAFAIKTNQSTTAFGITAGDEDFGIDTNGDATFNGNLDVNGILDVGPTATNPQMRLGKNTFATSAGAGISQLISGGSIFYDFKTNAAGSIFFRCGEGTEAGSAHQFMVVDPTDGSVKIPNLPTGTQVGLVGYDSTGKLIEADIQLTTQASTNPSTMAVDSSLYKQISANNLAQTCTIPLPTNGVDGSKVIYRFRASATSTLSWNAGFNDLKGALPTSIAINKSIYVGVIYDDFTSTWDVVSVVEQN